VSSVVCVVCPFVDDEKLKNIHVDLALLVWGPTLFSAHAPLTPWTHHPPSFFFFLSPPPSLCLSFPSFFLIPRFLFVLFFFFSFFLPWPPLLFFLLFSFPFFFKLLLCVCVRVSVYLRMYVRAYLAIPWVSANDNVKHIQSNIRYVFYKKTNKMK